MEISDRIKDLMKEKGISAYTLSNETGISQSTLSRILNKNSKPNASNLKMISEFFGVDKTWLLTGNNEYSPHEAIMSTEGRVTGFYFPNILAAAGMDKQITNYNLDKVPVYLPGWESNISFINVYGDSMYPKFCSGEIIGIKEVELQYINYGYAYVVILKDGQVLLKFIKKGSKDDSILLESENKFYESKEYHLDDIEKVFIIKGVITKTTM